MKCQQKSWTGFIDHLDRMSLFVNKKCSETGELLVNFYRTISSIIDATQPKKHAGPILRRAIALEVSRWLCPGDKTDRCVSQSIVSKGRIRLSKRIETEIET